MENRWSMKQSSLARCWDSVIWIGWVLLCFSTQAAAHNGAMAIAVPVAGIEVDGDLSDWPEGMRWYPVVMRHADRFAYREGHAQPSIVCLHRRPFWVFT